MPSPSTSKGWTGTVPACLVIICAGVLAYSNTLSIPLVFDDTLQIQDDPHIRHLWPPWESMSLRSAVPAGRPVVRLSYAVNYALARMWTGDGLDVRGYHVVDLGVHLLAALTIFGIVRRTLATRMERGAGGLAAAVALIWVLHPLQTQAVNYLWQRAEILSGLFFLLTLYCFIRSVGGGRSGLWQGLAVGVCALGMATKQVMVTAPLAVLLYDRVFVARSLRELLGERWKFYAGLAATWIILAALLIVGPPNDTAGFDMAQVRPLDYALTQLGVIVHYLRLSVWPTGLVFDYKWPIARTASAIVWPGLLVLGLLGVTAWGLWRRLALGFLGAGFFLVLAPSSSIMPIEDLCFEHRMYLALVSVVVLIVLGVHGLLRRLPSRGLQRGIGAGLTLAVVITLGTLTHARNSQYESAVSIWKDTLEKRPGNARAAYNIGRILDIERQLDDALKYYIRATRINLHHVDAWMGWAGVLIRQGKLEETLGVYREALAANPRNAIILHECAVHLLRMGRLDEAAEYFRKGLEIKPDYSRGHDGLGQVLAAQGKFTEAIDHYREAIRLDPDNPNPPNDLAWLLATCPEAALRDGPEAVRLAQTACRLTDYRRYAPLDTLAAAYAEAGRFEEAVRTAERAAELASAAGDPKTTADIREHLALFKARRPYRESVRQPAP